MVAEPSETCKTVDEKNNPGHINGLSGEQELALKNLWKKFLQYTRNTDGKSQQAATNGFHNTVDGPSGARGGGDDAASLGEKGKKAAKDDEAKAADAAKKEEEGMEELMADYGPEGFAKGFWQFCINEDPDCLMLRFLRARSWDVDRAFAMLAATVKWRLDTKIADIIRAGEEKLCEEPGIKKNLSTPKCYFHGTDKEGRPVIYAHVKYHKASDQNQDEMLKYIVLNMETARALLPIRSNVETASVVFDMTGFGLSNMDWDTATMVIKIFESYFPETLGHAIVWNAPTVFNAVWKIVKPMLDPAVREKVAFVNSGKDMEEFIDPTHLEKTFGGSSSWRYRFKAPVPGENKHMDDEEQKEKRIEYYKKAIEEFVEDTDKWINGDSAAGKQRREKSVKALEVRMLDLEPYVRGKTMYMRDGTVVGDGRVIWHYDHGKKEEFGKSTDDWAQDLGIEDPPERPRFDDEDIIELSTGEDTVSSTDDSESDILNDPHHKHHHAVAVSLAKVGDGIANGFSHLAPGPSIHEKKRRERAERQKRHEERRARKLALKKQRLEAERRRQEEAEDERHRREEEEENAINSSYSSYLARMAGLSLKAGNKVADYVPAVLGGNVLKQATTTEIPAPPAAAAA